MNSFDPIEKEIWETYENIKAEIKSCSNKKDVNGCLEKTSQLWMYMNRFRNCDLKRYYDEDIYEMISNLVDKREFKKHSFEIKNNFRIAFLFTHFNDLGGASIPHRFMLKNFEWEGNIVKNYYLITNFFKKDFPKTDSYDYLKNEIKPEVIDFLSPELSHEERSNEIRKWLKKNKIDFVIAGTCPSTLHALSSQPVPLIANLSQDCYTFTLGPGFGDITYLVTLDQFFKYKYSKSKPNHYSKLIFLPLHSTEQSDKAEAINLAQFNIPKGSVVSASSNMWKSFFGDGNDLMIGIKNLIKSYSNYHHIFIGTPRCLDNLENYLINNPEIKNNIHFIGPVKNIYKILKSIDFWVNSFPTTGGTNIEIAKLGKPSIEIAVNRNLDLHPAEFYCFNECTAINLDEFVNIGKRFIEDKKYRNDLGKYLKSNVSREFDKDRLVYDRIYKEFVVEYLRLAHKKSKMPEIKITKTLDYEKRIGFYNAYARKNWTEDKKIKWLNNCIKIYPEKPFGWIKLLEESILNNNFEEFINLERDIIKHDLSDYRIDVYLAFGHEKFNNNEKSLKIISKVINLISKDPLPKRLATRMHLRNGDKKVALNLYKEIEPKADINNIEEFLEKEAFKDKLPLYYDF